MSDDKRKEKNTILKWFGFWTFLQCVLMFFGGNLPWWITYLPAMLMALVLLLSGIAILLSYRKYTGRSVLINGKTIRACPLCPHRRIASNPISGEVIHCGAVPAESLVLNPHSIPGWCPYVVR